MEHDRLKVEWPKVINFDNELPYINWINLGNGTLFRIISFLSISTKPGLYVGIERVGCFIFTINENIPFSGKYVSEKLNIGSISDGNIIADWINAQLGCNAIQQGEYDRKYIEENEPYGLVMERPSLPCCPKIIED